MALGRQWLEAIKDRIAGSVSIEADDLQYTPFARWGDIGRAYTLFGKAIELGDAVVAESLGA